LTIEKYGKKCSITSTNLPLNNKEAIVEHSLPHPKYHNTLFPWLEEALDPLSEKE
jgi:hypothetical protein